MPVSRDVDTFHTILDEIDGKFVPPSPPTQIKDGKMARFGFCAASSLIWHSTTTHSISQFDRRRSGLISAGFCSLGQGFQSPLIVGIDKCLSGGQHFIILSRLNGVDQICNRAVSFFADVFLVAMHVVSTLKLPLARVRKHTVSS